VKAGKMEESFFAEEKLLRGHQNRPQERQGNPEQGKKIATESSKKVRRGDYSNGHPKHFQQLKDQLNFTTQEVDKRAQRLRGIPIELLH
jgi:hypothetical protein